MNMTTFPNLLAELSAVVVIAAVGPAQGTWVNRMAPPPGSCLGTLVAFDQQRGETVWFGDQGCRETWVWNGAVWQQRTSIAVPPAREVVGVHDSARNRVVALFGGFSGPFETWEWNGSQWTPCLAGSPPARQSYGLAYDAARGVTVLFGGRDNGGDGFADTWTWNGAVWTQVAFGGPTPRFGMGMVFDAQRQTVLLFGGKGSFLGQDIWYGDTWEWNGTYWMNNFGLAGPTPREVLYRFVWNDVRQRAVFYGGRNQSGAFTDMWEWNGVWTQVAQANNPGTSPKEMVFDRGRGVLVKLANTSPPAIWEFVPGPPVPASFTSYGAGCAGPNGVPTLATIGTSVPRIGATLQLRLTNLPPSPLNVALGFLGFDATVWNGVPLPLSLAPLGFPGCAALLAPIRSDTLANTVGFANWSIPLPMNALVVGTSVYFQGAVSVPGWNAGGFVFSNGGHAILGSP